MLSLMQQQLLQHIFLFKLWSFLYGLQIKFVLIACLVEKQWLLLQVEPFYSTRLNSSLFRSNVLRWHCTLPSPIKNETLCVVKLMFVMITSFFFEDYGSTQTTIDSLTLPVNSLQNVTIAIFTQVFCLQTQFSVPPYVSDQLHYHTVSQKPNHYDSFPWCSNAHASFRNTEL